MGRAMKVMKVEVTVKVDDADLMPEDVWTILQELLDPKITGPYGIDVVVEDELERTK